MDEHKIGDTAKKKVLLIGIDPKYIDYSKLPPVPANRTPEQIRKTKDDVTGKLEALGYKVQNCIIDAGETAGTVVSNLLSKESFDCIMIGG